MSNKKRDLPKLDSLNEMQVYLGTEMIDDYLHGQLSRRRMLARLIYICGGAGGAATLLTACGQPINQPTPTSAPKPTEAPKPTAAPASAPVVSPLSVAANDPAIEATSVTFDSDTKVSGYLARPKSASGNLPGVIVIHENRGLNDHIRDVARRLAKAGYIALAPDLVSRGGGTDALGADKVPGWLSQAKPEDLVKDMSAGVDFLQKQTGVNADKIGVVGFCFGGSQTIHLAAANAKIKAAVPYYGPVPKTLKPIGETNAAILAHYGGTDQRVNGTIPDIENAMKDAKKIYEKKIYDGAGHAFNNDTGGSYNEKAAVEAWTATLAWFDKYLKGK
jgi:carboxymethylenebutenolidase